MTETQTGELLVRLEMDPREERTVARMRWVGGLILAIGSALLLLGSLPLSVFLVGLLGLAMSLAWLRQADKAAARASDASEHYLGVYTRGFLLGEGGHETWVPWADVQGIEVDEERLDVVVARGTLPPIRVEPRYPGVEIHELMRTLRNAWEHASDP